MLRFHRFAWLALVSAVFSPSLQAQTYRGQGVGMGGLAGAVIGGVIGHQNDELAEGALIGGAVGAIAGGVIGHQKDQQAARQRYYRQQAYANTYRNGYAVPASVGVTTADVLHLTRNRVPDNLIIQHLYSQGVQRRIQVQEIIQLHQLGVSEPVISAMQHAPLASQVVHQVPAGTTTTIVTAPPTYPGTSYPAATYPGGSVMVRETLMTPPPLPATNALPPRRGF
ncbi:MAG: glycine zipper domain-containing protein [Pirellulaceae bacterium]|jgi:hypothetical protein